MAKQKFRTVDEYIASFSPEVQEILQKIRAIVRKAAPEAEETIKYQMPTFIFKGNLVYFAAFKNHIGFFPKASAIEAFKKQLSSYQTSKGTIQFPIDEPIPFDLVKEIVQFRVRENTFKK